MLAGALSAPSRIAVVAHVSAESLDDQVRAFELRVRAVDAEGADVSHDQRRPSLLRLAEVRTEVGERLRRPVSDEYVSPVED
jgi:hypothetical protein